MKRKIKRPSTPINEPLPGWIPLREAAFYCGDDGRMRVGREWVDALARDATRYFGDVVKSAPGELSKLECPKWSVEPFYGGPAVFISTSGIQMHINPGSVWILPDEDNRPNEESNWLIAGFSEKMLSDPEWDEIPACHVAGVRWLKLLLFRLFLYWQRNLIEALLNGRAQLMARKNGVLSPFERIMWDQWLFLEVDLKEERDVEVRPTKWFDVRRHDHLYLRDRKTSLATATSPSGEMVYSIYVVPDADGNADDNAEKCRRRIRDQIRENPDRSPISKDDLIDQLWVEHPNLLKKEVEFLILQALTETSHRDWFRGGRREKIPKNIPQE